jgi:hypothetical protein
MYNFLIQSIVYGLQRIKRKLQNVPIEYEFHRFQLKQTGIFQQIKRLQNGKSGKDRYQIWYSIYDP